jgi:membrane-bound serine protease (ClpP class)
VAKLVTRMVGLALVAAGLVSLGSTSTSASVPPVGDDAERRPVELGDVAVIQVTGLIDPIIATYLDRAISDAEADGDQAVILQVNSPGDVLSDRELDELVARIENADIPVTAWVGTTNAKAKGGAARLVLAADLVGMAPGTRLGDLDADDADGLPAELITSTVNPSRALDLGLSDLTQDEAAVLGNFLVSLDGRTVDGRKLEVAEQIDDGRFQPTISHKFVKPSLVEQTMHSVASPPVAYLLLTVGTLLLVLEFFTAGVGLAGVIGAFCLALGMYGVAVLPTRPWALLLLLASALAVAVDVQKTVPRVWTVIGLVMHLVGAVWLYHGLSSGWVALAAGVIGVALMAYTALPSLVRSRFSTPTIGREWMVGEVGEAVSAVDPDGVVRVGGATWKARTNRATPLAAGTQLRVAAIDGTVLEVEPLTGAARDHRERAKH